MSPRLLVAVDGGNSKTDVVVLDDRLRVVAEVRGPGASAHLLGAEGAVAALERLIDDALDQAGAGRADVGRAVLFLAGVDFDRERELMQGLIAERGWSGEVTVDNDTFALLRAGTGGPGVAVVCGAGINCVGTDQHGRVVRFPSLGRISGDWGGGRAVAEEVMAAAARDEDGRGPATALTGEVTALFDADSVLEVVERLHFGELADERLHELSPLLFAVAERGDAVALALVERLADEVAAMALSAIRRLQLASPTVVLGGGVLAARHPVLVDAVAARIDAGAPGAAIRYVAERPVIGAVLLGVESGRGPIGSEDAERLRRRLAARPDEVPV